MQLKFDSVSAVRARGSATPSEPALFRRDIPHRGHVVSSVTEKYAKPIRQAVRALAGSFEENDAGELRRRLLTQPIGRPAPAALRTEAEMAAWTVVSIWVAGVAIRTVSATDTLKKAEDWFRGRRCSDRLTDLISSQAIHDVESALHTYADATAYHELLPYIVDPHGPGSRLSVRRNPETRVARTHKRENGVFYTPADVAEYMVHHCLDSVNGKAAPTVFDPACGTGVFLRTALRALTRRHPETSPISLASEHLFGTDIDPWPLDATAFVLLADAWSDELEPDQDPISIWRGLRSNLGFIDTLLIDPIGTNRYSSSFTKSDTGRVAIDDLFPKLNENPTVVVGNPPYATLGARSDLRELGDTYQTLRVRPHASAQTYLAFTEQLIRLANRKECAGALVLPLSIACNTGPRFTAIRQLIQRTAGRWRFAFFDREPHALFGEEVKTRNSILFWSRRKSDTECFISSGPLRKWRGESRGAMFKNIQFTPINRDIGMGIPKVDGTLQASVLETLGARSDCLEQSVEWIEKRNLADTPNADDRLVFVGPTAYNFLNVFLRPPPFYFPNGTVLSKNSLHALRCTSAKDALAVFGILTSHLAFWWWHAHGDGFHVSKNFVSRFPFCLRVLGESLTDDLARWGEDLWYAVKLRPTTSLNRGRTSLAYATNCHDEKRRRIDQALAESAGLPHRFVDELQQFTTRVVEAKVENYQSKGEG